MSDDQHSGANDGPNDSALIEAMRELAKRAEMDVRKNVYLQLLLAELLVPMLDGATVATTSAGDWFVRGELGGRPTYEVFSNLKDYQKKHRQRPYARLKGTAVFVRLASAKAGSVRINPGGRIGGELYGHEIETLANAAPRIGGRGDA